jgi:uncharacterized protein involved in exopolysaccharide biosynthesis
MSATTASVELDLSSAGEGSRLLEFVSLLQRRGRQIGIAFGSLLLTTILLTFFWPPTYESTGIVLIEQQEVPEEFVQAAVTSYADQRVKMISQRVMTTSNLLEIIRKYGLYADRQRREPREKLLDRMRDDIGLEMISADVVDPKQGRATKATIAFAVSYESDTATVAAKVANELTTLYLNENATTRRQLAADTAQFLRQEAERVGKEVADLDRRVAEFKSLHAAALPELSQVNIQLAARAEEDLRGLGSRIMALDQQRMFLDTQLTQVSPVATAVTEDGMRVAGTGDRLKVLRAQLASARARYQPDHPDVVRLQREVAGLEREVGSKSDAAELERQLAQAKDVLAKARSKYSPEHPDVKRYERLVQYIESAMRASPVTQAPRRAEEAPDNPAYLQLRTQREAVMAERSALEREREMARARIADLDGRMTSAPGVEREYMALTRDLEGAQLKYQEVRQKQMAAQLAQNLETEQKGERFTLIEPPLVPERPTSPNRPLLFFLGLFLSIAGALGYGMLRDQIEGRVRGSRDLLALAGVAPLAVVPYIDARDPAQVRQTRRVRVWWYAGAAMAALLAVLAAIHYFYRPLDVIWLVLLRRLGL